MIENRKNHYVEIYKLVLQFWTSIRGLGGVAVRVLISNLWGRWLKFRAGRFMLESW